MASRCKADLTVPTWARKRAWNQRTNKSHAHSVDRMRLQHNASKGGLHRLQSRKQSSVLVQRRVPSCFEWRLQTRLRKHERPSNQQLAGSTERLARRTSHQKVTVRCTYRTAAYRKKVRRRSLKHRARLPGACEAITAGVLTRVPCSVGQFECAVGTSRHKFGSCR